MSEHTKAILEITSLPMAVKNPRKDSMVLSLPTQSRRVNLIDKGQVFVPFGVLDFVDPDRLDLAENPMLQPEGDDVFDGVENLFPGSAERLGCFLPRQATRPAGQKQHVCSGQRTLPIAPRHFLDDDGLAVAAIDAPHGVQQKNQESPERDELETPFGELIVTGRRLMAARTNRRRTLARPHGNLNTLVIGTEASLLVNESRKAVTAV